MLTGISYELRRIVDCHGGGSAPANLTGSYTPGAVVSVIGVGAVRLSGKCAFSGSSTITVRLMDYTDPANPRPIAIVNPGNPGAGAISEQAFTTTIPWALEANLGGVVNVIAVEKKANGVPASGDTVTVDGFASEKF